MKFTTVLAGLLLMLCAVPAVEGLSAQTAAQVEFPVSRLRGPRPEAVTARWYQQSRIIIRRMDISLVGSGMQISGEVLVDFECDSAPPALMLPSGPVMDLVLDVQLYESAVRLNRNPQTGLVDQPRFDTRTPGRVVDGQSTQCRTDRRDSADRRFGVANFTLPALPRALAPGIYNLIVSMNFAAQGQRQRDQIMWCSDFWGVDDQGIDPILGERILVPIMGHPTKHAETWTEVLTVQGSVSGNQILYVADLLNAQNNIVLRTPAAASAREPANFVVVDQYIELIGEAESRARDSQAIDADLEDLKANPERQARLLAILQRNNPRATVKDLIEIHEKQAALSKKSSADLIRMYGGPATVAESRMRAAAVASIPAVLEQIKRFHDYLAYRYWVLMDGWLTYAGYHTVNKPGGNMFEAVKSNDVRKDGMERERKLNELKEQPGALEARDRKRTTDWAREPEEIRKLAFAYLNASEELGRFDARHFAKMEGRTVVMNVAEWRKYTLAVADKLYKDTEKLYSEIDTSVRYANAVWPELLAEARAARDDVICVAFSWEYWTRVDLLKDEAAKNEMARQVVSEWNDMVRESTDRDLSRYVMNSQTHPGGVYQRLRGRLDTIRAGAKVSDFAQFYKKALDAKAVLPGQTIK